MFSKLHDRNTILKSIQLRLNGLSFRKIATSLNVGKSSVHRWFHTLHSIVGHPRIQKRKKHKRQPKFPKLVEDIKTLFVTSEHLKYCDLHTIQAAIPYKVSTSWIRQALKSACISRRRFSNLHVILNKKSQEAKIQTFKQTIRDIPLHEITCLDEVHFCNRGNTLYGYFPKGKKPTSDVSPRRLSKSCLMAISTSGVVHSVVQNKPFDQDSFLDFMKALIPMLPSHVKYILMDNVAFHHTKIVTEFLASKDIKTLFIPPYSPQFNPIEEVFSHLKASYRKQFLIHKLTFDQSIHAAITDLKNYYHIISHYEKSFRI